MSGATASLSVPKEGETENGDAVVVREEGGRRLLALIDSLGHGAKAAEASRRAVSYLETCLLDGALLELMAGLHEALRGSRGAAAMVCRLEGRSIEGCGVGNVDLRCSPPGLPVLLSPGVLGSRVQLYRPFRGELAKGTRLVFFSDGVSQRAPLQALRHLTPPQLCEELLRTYRKSTDDATALVCDIEA